MILNIKSFIDKLRLSIAFKDNKVSKQKNAQIQIQNESGTTTVVNNQIFVLDSTQVAKFISPVKDPLPRIIVEESLKQNNLNEVIKRSDFLDSKAEIDSNWFLKWMDVAKLTSEETLRDMLAQILNTESSSPNSFSSRTLQIVSILSRAEIEAFKKFLAICSNNGEFVFTVKLKGTEDFTAYGLKFSELLALRDVGLVQSNDNTHLKPNFRILGLRFGTDYHEYIAANKKIEVPIVSLTTSGIELMKLFEIKHNPQFIHDLRFFLESLGFKWKDQSIIDFIIKNSDGKELTLDQAIVSDEVINFFQRTLS